MENIVYHGTTITNLKVIIPQVAIQNEEAVYASPQRLVALMMANRPSSLELSMGMLPDGTYDLCERKEGVFATFYDQKGSIYQLDGNKFSTFDSFNWSNNEVIAKTTQPVIAEEKITSFLEELRKYEQEGLVHIYSYPKRPIWIPNDDTDLIHVAFKLYELYNKDIKWLHQLLEDYPQFTTKVNEEYERIQSMDTLTMHNYIADADHFW